MKAIVFCHFHHDSAVYKPEQQLGAQEVEEITKSVLSYYKAYLSCKNIGLVYVYVDTGIKEILDHIFRGDEKITIDINELAFEHTVRNILKLAAHQALVELSKEKGLNTSDTPKFQFIGLPHLASLIASLYRMDKDLVTNLSGRGNFTYDAPKFVEAVIRLARGNDRDYPILRFDQDVEANEKAIEILLAKIADTDAHSYSFFSGGYGRSSVNDPINDHAVRCHWLADTKNYPNRPPYHLIPNGEHFLRDIGEFGATSIPNSKGIAPSIAMNDYITRQGGYITNRDSEQVISGAGLYMSLKAIQRLPPFMNLEKNILWVDDYLKRRLHETLGDIATIAPQHINDSLFHQDRYPEAVGIQERDYKWAKERYFYRLISGCIMNAFIADREGKPGRLSKFVEKYLRTRQKSANSEFDNLATDFVVVAKDIVSNLLEIWSKADYGNDVLQKWAEINLEELKRADGELVEWINSTVIDAIHYCKLVENWGAYTTAIQDLVPHDAYWLFRSID